MRKGNSQQRCPSRLVLVFALLALTGCPSPTNDNNTTPPDETLGSFGVRLEVPGGVDVGQLRLVTGFGSTAVQSDGTARAIVYGAGTQLGIVVSASGNPMLLGWLRGDGAVITPRSTAEVLAFFAVGGFAVPEENQVKIMELITGLAELDAVAHAIADSLAVDAESLGQDNPAVREALEALVRGWGFQAAGKPSPARVLISPSDEQSGVRVNQLGVNRINFRNRYRRACWAFVERDSYLGADDKWHYSPEALTDLEVPSVKGLSSAVGTFVDIMNGQMAYAEVATPGVQLSVVPDSKKTRYTVSVVGFGDRFGPLYTLPAAQQAKQQEVALTWFVKDIFLPFATNIIIPGLDMQADKYERFFTENSAVKDYTGIMTSTIPAIQTALDQGDLRGALWEAWNGLSGSDFFMNKTLDLVMDLIEFTSPSRPQAGAEALGMANKVLGAVGLVDKILYGFDTLQVIGALLDVRMAEVWTVDVTKPDVKLTPAKSRVLPYDYVRLTARVPEAVSGAGEGPVLTYHWHNTGEAGSIADTRHTADDFDSSDDAVVYVADRDTYGTDTITVDVYELVGSTKERVGTATATIEVAGTKVALTPEAVTIKASGTAGFSAAVEPAQDDVEVVFIWSSTARAGHLAADGGADAFETTTQRPVYTASADGRGTDTIDVEAFKVVDGERESLGTATATVSVSPYVVTATPKQSVIPNRGTATLTATLAPAPPASAVLKYRWTNTGWVGDLRGGNEHDSTVPQALYLSGAGGKGADHVKVEVFEQVDDEWISLGLDDALVTVGSARMTLEFIPASVAMSVGETTSVSAVLRDPDG